MKTFLLACVAISTLISCGPTEPKPIKLNSDSCDNCKMTISNSQFAAEVITKKGRIYKFDDIACMVNYAKANKDVEYSAFFANDYLKENNFINVEKGFFLTGGTIKGPMGGNAVIFLTQKDADSYKSKLSATASSWKEVYNSN